MNRLTTSVPNYKKMRGHGHPSSVIPVNEDSMINYKEAVRTHTSGLKPKTVAYCNFGKGTGRDANIYMNERTRNVALDNTKE